MHYYPYPPEWFKKTSVDPLTAWDEYRDSLMYWAEDWWDDFFEDELRSVWKMTLYAGTAALILMILLFLETRPTQKIQQVVSVPKVKTSAPVFKKEVEPEIKKPKKRFDPFAKYAEQPEEPPSVPLSSPFPKPSPVFTPPVTQPELFAQSVKTGLLPDDRHFEKTSILTAQSRFVSLQQRTTLLADGWRVPKPGNQFDTSTKEVVSWFDSPAAHKVNPSTKYETGVTPLDSLQLSSAVVLTKQMPENITPGTKMSYKLVVKNRSSVVQSRVIVEEIVSDQRSVVDVVPAAQVSNGALRWVIHSLKPGEERQFNITVIASQGSAVLQSQTRLQLTYAIASKTIVFVPDVVVSLTLPVSVEKSEEFPVQIEISNNSDRLFAESDLKIRLLQGVLMNHSKEMVRKVKIPAPGKSITLPITLTAAEIGTGIIEAELDLDDSLMIPVKAHTSIRAGKTPEEKKSREALVKKISPQLAEVK